MPVPGGLWLTSRAPRLPRSCGAGKPESLRRPKALHSPSLAGFHPTAIRVSRCASIKARGAGCSWLRRFWMHIPLGCCLMCLIVEWKPNKGMRGPIYYLFFSVLFLGALLHLGKVCEKDWDITWAADTSTYLLLTFGSMSCWPQATESVLLKSFMEESDAAWPQTFSLCCYVLLC